MKEGACGNIAHRARTVLWGLEDAWFFAASPMSRSPSSVHATYDGVIR